MFRAFLSPPATLLALGLSAQVSLAEPPSLEAWLEGEVAAGEVLSGVVAVVHADHAMISGFGQLAPEDERVPDGDTQYEIGSITKVLTNLLLAELVAAGEVGYDTRIGALIADEPPPRNPAVADITLQELATHRSGLPRLPGNLLPGAAADPYAGYDARSLRLAVQVARDRQPLAKRYAYSNFGVGLLGHLLGQHTGEGYLDAVTRRVIRPLGLRHTGFEETDNRASGYRNGEVVPAWGFEDALAGAGGAWGTAADLVRLAQVYLGQVNHRLGHDLAADLEVVGEGGEGFSVTRVWHVARAGEAPIYWHNGGTGGYWSFIGFRPDTQQAVVVLVAGDSEPSEEALAYLGHTPRRAASAAVDEGLFGQYQASPQFGVGVYAEDGVLVAQATGQPALPLEPVGQDWYRFTTVDASLRFVRDEDGAVTGLEVAQNGRLIPAARTAAVATAAARRAIDLGPEALQDYVGRYQLLPQAVFTITLDDGQLRARLTGQPALPVFPAGEDVFFYRAVDAELHFERDDAGAVSALVLHQGGMRQRAPRMQGGE